MAPKIHPASMLPREERALEGHLSAGSGGEHPKSLSAHNYGKEVDKSAGLNKAGENNYAQDSSAGKESACHSGDTDSVPGLGRSPGEGKGYPLQCSVLENST